MSSSTLDLLLKKGAAETPAGGDTSAADQPDADVNIADEAGVSIELPSSKTALMKLKVGDLDALHTALDTPILDWSSLTGPSKKTALADFLFNEDGTAKFSVNDGATYSETDADGGEAVAEKEEVEHLTIGGKATKTKTKTSYANDPLSKLAKEIETLTDQGEIEKRITETFEQDGLNDFILGGLFTKLNDVGDFGEFKSFGPYVEAKYDVKYRKARYLMSIYTVLISLEIPYDEVKHVGWTKLKELTPILSKDNYQGWIKKAEAMNTDSLSAEVKAAIVGGPTDEHGEQQAQPVKSVVTKSLKLHDDQLETYNDAIAKAKAIVGTDSDTVAMDAILMEYVGTATAKKGSPDTASAEPILDPVAFFKAVADKFPGDPKSAMLYIFGDEVGFDSLFPTVVLDVSFKKA